MHCCVVVDPRQFRFYAEGLSDGKGRQKRCRLEGKFVQLLWQRTRARFIHSTLCGFGNLETLYFFD